MSTNYTYHYAATLLFMMYVVMGALHLCEAVCKKFEVYRNLKTARQRCVALWAVRSIVCELAVLVTFGWGVMELFWAGLSLDGLGWMWTGFHLTFAVYCCELFFRPTEVAIRSSLFHHVAMLAWGNYMAWSPSLPFLQHSVYMQFMGIGVSPWPCNVAFFVYYFRKPTKTTVNVMKASHGLLLVCRVAQWAGWSMIVAPLFPVLSPVEQVLVSTSAVVFFYVEFQLPYTLYGMIKSYERKMKAEEDKACRAQVTLPAPMPRRIADMLG
eukprot:TRINITY_DN844_c0_g5_i1.p1 TRINITY_DN844_c0_g5~~TRINITY_DN844_c0_g5_i1.p1  ORF type:complete len:268 (+),score=42.45 TRINITY_DN844_c0_g5_i1:57-860(+)